MVRNVPLFDNDRFMGMDIHVTAMFGAGAPEIAADPDAVARPLVRTERKTGGNIGSKHPDAQSRVSVAQVQPSVIASAQGFAYRLPYELDDPPVKLLRLFHRFRAGNGERLRKSPDRQDGQSKNKDRSRCRGNAYAHFPFLAKDAAKPIAARTAMNSSRPAHITRI